MNIYLLVFIYKKYYNSLRNFIFKLNSYKYENKNLDITINV